MLTPGIAQLHYLRHEPEPRGGGIVVGRGVSVSSYKPPFEDEYARHLQQLEDIRLVGYRFLKPPGVAKTLRAIHEDEAFAAESTAEEHSLNSMASDASNANTSTPAARSGTAAAQVARSEDNSMLAEEDESGDDVPDFSLPALNASFPSLYYQS